MCRTTAPRSANGVLGVIDNQLQNLGGIDSSGFDLALAYSSPDWRWVTTLDRSKSRWGTTLAFRWTDSMTLSGGNKVDFAMFADLRLSYRPSLFGDGVQCRHGARLPPTHPTGR
ncbi:MAG: hypothetical protein F4149_12585 [Gammaproteobacteria bacterium]|nr:hypothetical protein [Gammaproteobacteria bacterium]MYK83481.1 hypothetical protein [Gammaproteobacteria bacterium]